MTIGGGESDAMRLLARTAVALKKAHPQVRFTLSGGNLDDLSDIIPCNQSICDLTANGV